ncbi:MAG: recombination mediator RecR [Patescibacteria group bacterium]
MYPQSIQKLIEYFTRIPGIGPRAAGRFVFFLLKEDPEFLKEFGTTLASLSSSIGQCAKCFTAVERDEKTEKLCALCANKNRNHSMIMVVEKESDLLSVERSGSYKGLYHVLGGVVSLMDSESTKKLTLRELYARASNAKKNDPSLEIILATNPTPEGDVTANYIERILEPLAITLTRLGRGITAGSELEYIDETTMLNALKNRK